MSGQTPAYVRTGTPIGVGAVIVYIAKQLGVNLSVDQALLLAPAVMYAYYVLGRALEHLNPTLGWILGVAKQPAYSQQDPPQPPPDLAEEEWDGFDPIITHTSDGVPIADRVGDPLEQPVQTDNRPRDEDGEQLDEDIAPLIWTGKEMRD